MKSIKHYFLLSLISALSLLLMNCEQKKESASAIEPAQVKEDMAKTLRHVVLFKFNDAATPKNVANIEKAFANLPSEIKEIKAFEWGLNNSPEQLSKGFTHAFFVSFASEDDRATYLPHPAHLAFIEILKPHLEDVLVIDYWTS